MEYHSTMHVVCGSARMELRHKILIAALVAFEWPGSVRVWGIVQFGVDIICCVRH